MTDPNQVTSLPDYPSLERLTSALWSSGPARGAAVLVGAGFSLNAERAGHDTKVPPLWSDLRSRMAGILYHDRPDEAPADPLRLAEEFRTYLGQAALVEFIRVQVPDASWRPGRLHTDLMALPWAEVLTTNYDTLLERASRRHQVVRGAADLAQVRGPRVIKLHGSIEGNARLVIAEEDYRTYPVESAAFVNTARQIFLENELCLVGFSGDDPNFLQWSGWVRDHLGENARRIYLIGALKLSPAKRRFLESRNVAPIDFSLFTGELPRFEAEQKACEIFLAHLAASKPKRASDWEPSYDYDFIPPDPQKVNTLLSSQDSAKPLLDSLHKVWVSDTANCPDWLVMPLNKRRSVSMGTSRVPWGLPEALNGIAAEQRAEMLILLCWRQASALEPIDADVISSIEELSIEPGKLPDYKRVELLRIVFREFRFSRNEIGYGRSLAALASLITPGSDAYADLVLQKLLWARDGIDFFSVSRGLKELEGPDPFWKMARASLHCDCGEMVTARALVDELFADLSDRQRQDPNSISVSSRQAWVNVFRRALRLSETMSFENGKEQYYLLDGYDADEEIDKLRRQLRDSRLRRIEAPRGYQPQFGPGSYKDHSHTITFKSAALGHEAETIFRLADTAGLPLRVDGVDILMSMTRDSLENEPLPTINWYLRLVRSMDTSAATLDRHFGSVAIARLGSDVANELTRRVFEAAQFWASRIQLSNTKELHDAVGRLQVYLGVLSRLIIRSDPAKVQDVFRFGLGLASDPGRHFWLNEPLGELLKWSLLSLPPAGRSVVALDCLELPLPTSDSPAALHWPDPVEELFARATPAARVPSDQRWIACVAKLLVALGSAGRARAHAAHSLAYLSFRDSLEPRELAEFGRLLWSLRDPEVGDLPRDVNLYPHVIAALPAPAEVNAEGIVRAYLFGDPIKSASNEAKLRGIFVAARNLAPADKILPTRTQAIELLDALIGSQANPAPNTGPFSDQLKERLTVNTSHVVGGAVLPALEASDLTEQRVAFIDLCCGPGNGGGVLAGQHELVRLAPEKTTQVIARLLRALARGDLQDVAGASQCISDWAENGSSGRYPAMPPSLKDAVVASLEVGVRQGLQPRLWCARRLFESKAFSDYQGDSLSRILPEIWRGLAYDKMPQEGAAAIGVTLAKGECVRLAAAMAAGGYAVDHSMIDVEDDPLPEVRFAKLYQTIRD